MDVYARPCDPPWRIRGWITYFEGVEGWGGGTLFLRFVQHFNPFLTQMAMQPTLTG